LGERKPPWERQGKWVITAYVSNGNDPKEKSPDSVMVGCLVEISKERLTLEHPKESLKKQASCKIDTTKKPKHIDLQLPKEEKVLGIYAFDGATLRICTGFPGKERPTEIENKKGQTLWTLKRAKP
jgi:uncharacterized protein (TIGR03067 family)